MSGCSFEEVGDRVQRRGTCSVPVLDDVDAAEWSRLISMPSIVIPRELITLGERGVAEAIHSNSVNGLRVRAFDDGSYVLQFDVEQSRLVAFVNTDSPDDLLGSIREEWLN